MQTQTRKPLRAEAVMAIIAAIIALVLGVITWLSWPYITAEPAPVPTQPVAQPVTQPTTEPTTVPTEPPTEPTEPPELNPYGKLDFQYEGDYLKCLRTETVPGIDVSAFQGEVDWERVAASGIKFAFVRLGYRGYGKAGTLVEDEYARRNLEGARAAGLEVGVYFFSQAVNTQEVKEEVDFMIQIMGDFQPDLPVVFDWEYISDTARTANMDRRTLTDCALEFGRLIEEKGFEPMIYFNPNQSRRLLYLKELEKYPFWLAFYTDRMTYPYKVDYWQYTCTGRVPGIQGDVDINIRFYD